MAEFKIDFISETSDLNVDFNDDTGFGVDGFGVVTNVVTKDYNKLDNKPTINSVEVVGDKTGPDYRLQNKLIAGDYITLDGTTISADLEYATYAEVLALLSM